MLIRVVFLLPKRCASDSGFISRARRLINQHDIANDSSQKSLWDVRTYDKNDGVSNVFDFCDRIIHQDVVIQVWQQLARR